VEMIAPPTPNIPDRMPVTKPIIRETNVKVTD
jgi:hypothetical protein